MFLQSPSKLGPEAAAVVTGGFLAGAMADLSLVVMPVLFDTVKDAALMTEQWARIYFYGHIIYPGLCITTVSMYAYAAYAKRAKGLKWRTWALAAAITIAMVPFTWIFMAPTNNLIFDRYERSRTGENINLDEVRVFVTRWSGLHTARCLFPLIGAVIGLLGKKFNEIAAVNRVSQLDWIGRSPFIRIRAAVVNMHSADTRRSCLAQFGISVGIHVEMQDKLLLRRVARAELLVCPSVENLGALFAEEGREVTENGIELSVIVLPPIPDIGEYCLTYWCKGIMKCTLAALKLFILQESKSVMIEIMVASLNLVPNMDFTSEVEELLNGLGLGDLLGF